MAFADYAYVISNGVETVFEGTGKDLPCDSRVQKIYLGLDEELTYFVEGNFTKTALITEELQVLALLLPKNG